MSARRRGIMRADDVEPPTGAGGTNSGGDGVSSASRMRRAELLELIHDFLYTRPAHIEKKTGDSGRKINCVTNYIPVESRNDWMLFQYHVSFQPTVDAKATRQRLLSQHEELLGKDPVFDGTILYLPYKLKERPTRLESRMEREGAKTETVEVTVKLTNELPPTSPQCITIFNLCNRKGFQLMNYLQIGRHFYDPSQAGNIKAHKIEIWPGFISAIRAHEESLLMCCEMSHKLLRTDTVLDFMYGLYSQEKERFHERCVQELVGTSVLTRYNNKTYRVDDILWDMRPTDEFEMTDGTRISFKDYYQQQYNRAVQDTEQPMLLSRARRRGDDRNPDQVRDIFLIPELCAMTGLTDQMRSDRRVMQELAQFTRVAPADRIKYATGHLARLKASDDVRQLFDTWNLRLGEGLEELTARVLPAEGLMAGEEKPFSYSPESGDWARESRNTRLLQAAPLQHWILVFPARDLDKAESFYKTVSAIGPRIGMEVAMPEIVKLDNDRVNTYLEAIQYGREQQPKAQMVVTMLPNDNKTRYDAIKKLCCLDNPIPNQVLRSNTVTKNLVSVCTKLILQMNCKLGGSLWRVHIPMRNSMMIGYDVYHDSANRGKTVGSAVFSLNPQLTRWYSQCALHGESKQLISNLEEFCEKGLRKFHEVNGTLPDRIFLFRDGCGDGQIPVVYRQELPQIQAAISRVGRKLAEDYKPKLAFIIVTKRVNARFFESQGSQLKNPPPGTVVDSVVTRPERYDFYLVPQCVRQGTVTPVSYNVIFDESGLSPDNMQRLAYKLCHLYYNWQGTIRVPAPCQYAHKLAFLVGQSLHKPADESLADKLYFL